MVEWLEHVLHPWTSFVIVPLFALANAGVTAQRRRRLPTRRPSPRHLRSRCSDSSSASSSASPLFTWLAARARRSASLPDGVDAGRRIAGVAAVAGIGFTVSIFVTGLAFDDPAIQDEAKIAILAAAVVAGGSGALILSRHE